MFECCTCCENRSHPTGHADACATHQRGDKARWRKTKPVVEEAS